MAEGEAEKVVENISHFDVMGDELFAAVVVGCRTLRLLVAGSRFFGRLFPK